MVYLKENCDLLRFQRGSSIFQGGGGSKFFQGVLMLISLGTYKTRDFSGEGGGVRTPYPHPLDSSMTCIDFCLFLQDTYSRLL